MRLEFYNLTPSKKTLKKLVNVTCGWPAMVS